MDLLEAFSDAGSESDGERSRDFLSQFGSETESAADAVVIEAEPNRQGDDARAAPTRPRRKYWTMREVICHLRAARMRYRKAALAAHNISTKQAQQLVEFSRRVKLKGRKTRLVLDRPTTKRRTCGLRLVTRSALSAGVGATTWSRDVDFPQMREIA